MKAPGPTRVLAIALATTGVVVIALNRGVEPDESRILGAGLLLLGLLGAVWPARRGLRTLVEIVAVVSMMLAGGEWMVRRENGIAQRAYAERTMRFVDDPVLRYEMKPDIKCGVGSTNDRGMIDVQRALPKPPGTLRVACLGDSVGGDCSLPQDNACASLEGVLREARGGAPVEVLNFSTPGYNTMQEARALETKALPFQPDAVVVLYVLNDPFPDLAISHYLPGHLKFEHLLFGAGYMGYLKLAHPDENAMGLALAQLHDNPRAWNGVVVQGFDRIQAVAQARGIPVAVAVFPLFVEHPGPTVAGVYQKVVAEADRHGFVGVNLSQEAFASEPLSALLKPSHDFIHPNAHAHHLAAQAIARALLARHPELATR